MSRVSRRRSPRAGESLRWVDTSIFASVASVQAALVSGHLPSVNYVFWGDRTPLQQAAGSGAFEVCEFLASSGGSVNACTPEGFTPLHIAAEAGRVDVCECLVAHGADVNAEDKMRVSVLAGACGFGQIDVCAFLISKGAAINGSGNAPDLSPLSTALRMGQLDVCTWLLEQGADVGVSLSSVAWDETLPSCAMESSSEACELLFGIAPAEAVRACASTSLTHFADKGYLGLCQFLIAQGADVNHADGFGVTALHSASLNGQTDVCQLLLDEGANACLWSITLGTPIEFASYHGHIATCELLVAYGAPVPTDPMRHPELLASLGPYLAAIRDASWKRRLPAYIAVNGVWWT